MNNTPHFLAAMSEPTPKALTPVDIIDAHSKHLIAQMTTLRDHAHFLRQRANDADMKADAIRAELGDWNRVRAAALQGQPSERVLGTGSAS